MPKLETIPKTIQNIYNIYKDKLFIVNRKYQRKLVWTLLEKQKLIESIINGYPIPAIILAENDGRYEIIDGLQRLHTICSFIEMNFPIKVDGNDYYFNIELFPTAKANLSKSKSENLSSVNINMINEDCTTKILDYNISFSIVRSASEEEIEDVFKRINTYGHQLSDQERRQAGVRNKFSEIIRNISTKIRGDITEGDIIELSKMPEISIDLPKTKHGYSIKAENIFWVKHGILKSKDLRDSMDEQCIADIVACNILGEPIERSKTKLDEIFDSNSHIHKQIINGINSYGEKRIEREFLYIIEEIEKISNINSKKLNDIIFETNNTNPYQSIFSIIFIALYELIIKENMEISDYKKFEKSIKGISKNITTGKSAVTKESRRTNINAVKGIMQKYMTKRKKNIDITENTIINIERYIREYTCENPGYELKQGILNIHNKEIDTNLLDKICQTIVAIANNCAPGVIIIGVCDNDKDAKKIERDFNINAKEINGKYVVGIKREIKHLNICEEEYLNIISRHIEKSEISSQLKSDVLSNLSYNDFYNYGIVVINIPKQKEVSYLGENIYFRKNSSTVKAKTQKEAIEVSKRFSK